MGRRGTLDNFQWKPQTGLTERTTGCGHLFLLLLVLAGSGRHSSDAVIYFISYLYSFSFQKLQKFYKSIKNSTATANSIFARVVRLTSEEVMVQLLKQKCLPILLYALEVCNLDKRVLQSLDFTVNGFFMKLFRTSNIETVLYCQTVFGCDLPSVLLVKRYDKFTERLTCTSV